MQHMIQHIRNLLLFDASKHGIILWYIWIGWLSSSVFATYIKLVRTIMPPFFYETETCFYISNTHVASGFSFCLCDENILYLLLLFLMTPQLVISDILSLLKIFYTFFCLLLITYQLVVSDILVDTGLWRIQACAGHVVPHCISYWSISFSKLHWKTETATSGDNKHVCCLVSSML